MVDRGEEGFVSISSTALNDLVLGNLIDTGQTGRPDFKRARLCRPSPLSLLFLPYSSPTLPNFVRVVKRCLENPSHAVDREKMTRWKRQRLLAGIAWETGARCGRSNSKSVRTIIWRWQRDGQDERSTSPSTLTSSRQSFLSSFPPRLRVSANARHRVCIKCYPHFAAQKYARLFRVA